MTDKLTSEFLKITSFVHTCSCALPSLILWQQQSSCVGQNHPLLSLFSEEAEESQAIPRLFELDAAAARLDSQGAVQTFPANQLQLNYIKLRT